MQQILQPVSLRDLFMLFGIFSIWLPIILRLLSLTVSIISAELAQYLLLRSRQDQYSYDLTCLLCLRINVSLWLLNAKPLQPSNSNTNIKPRLVCRLLSSSFQSICICFITVSQCLAVAEESLCQAYRRSFDHDMDKWLLHGGSEWLKSDTTTFLRALWLWTVWIEEHIRVLFLMFAILKFVPWLFRSRHQKPSSQTHGGRWWQVSPMSLAFALKQVQYCSSSAQSIFFALVRSPEAGRRLIPLIWLGEGILQSVLLLFTFLKFAVWIYLKLCSPRPLRVPDFNTELVTYEVPGSSHKDVLQRPLPGALSMIAYELRSGADDSKDSPAAQCIRCLRDVGECSELDATVPRCYGLRFTQGRAGQDRRIAQNMARISGLCQDEEDSEATRPNVNMTCDDDAVHGDDADDQDMQGNDTEYDADNESSSSSLNRSDLGPSDSTVRLHNARRRADIVEEQESRCQSHRGEITENPVPPSGSAESDSSDEVCEVENEFNCFSFQGITYGPRKSSTPLESPQVSPKALIPRGEVDERFHWRPDDEQVRRGARDWTNASLSPTTMTYFPPYEPAAPTSPMYRSNPFRHTLSKTNSSSTSLRCDTMSVRGQQSALRPMGRPNVRCRGSSLIEDSPTSPPLSSDYLSAATSMDFRRSLRASTISRYRMRLTFERRRAVSPLYILLPVRRLSSESTNSPTLSEIGSQTSSISSRSSTSTTHSHTSAGTYYRRGLFSSSTERWLRSVNHEAGRDETPSPHGRAHHRGMHQRQAQRNSGWRSTVPRSPASPRSRSERDQGPNFEQCLWNLQLDLQELMERCHEMYMTILGDEPRRSRSVSQDEAERQASLHRRSRS